MLPIVVTYSLPASSTTFLAAAQGSGSGALTLTTTVLGANQQRITVTSAGNDNSIYFHAIGLNQAGFTVSEYFAGSNSTTAQSNLDYKSVISIQPSSSSVAQTLGTTAATVSAGTNGVGSTLWFIQNWHATPSNVEYGCVLQSGNATFSIQYTYDDPNNLPAGVPYPQPFNHPTIVNATASIDGSSNDPITAWRLLISAGQGVVRATGIQAGIGGP